jgi:hypothetical protein
MNITSRGTPVIHVSSRAAKVHIKQKRPTMTVTQKSPRMIVRRKAPKFKVNRSVINVKTNYQVPLHISKRFLRARAAQQQPFSDSDMIEINNFDLVDLQLEELESLTLSEELESLVVDELQDNDSPMQTVSLEWEQGALDIDWTENVMEINWDIDPTPEIYVEPHELKIYFQYEHGGRNLKIRAVKTPTGIKVDKKI